MKPRQTHKKSNVTHSLCRFRFSRKREIERLKRKRRVERDKLEVAKRKRERRRSLLCSKEEREMQTKGERNSEEHA